MKVLLLNGSPARPSHTKATLQFIADVCTEKHFDAEIIDLVDFPLPINDPLHHADASKHPDERVRELASKVKASDIVVLGSPLYHGSFSGLLKSALDNLDGDAFSGKKVILAGNSWGPRNATNTATQLAIVPQTMGGDVYNRSIGTCNEDFDESGDTHVLSSSEIKDRVTQIITEVTQTT